MKIIAYIHDALKPKRSAIAVCLFLALLLLFPKVLLVSYTNDVLWGKFDYTQSLGVILQDALLAVLYFIYLSWSYNKKSRYALICAFFLSGVLLGFLLLDTRVRQLWLQPINIELIQYALTNYKDLMSGSDAFLKYYSGFGMTFRRIVFVVACIHTLLFLMLFFLQKSQFKSKQFTSIQNEATNTNRLFAILSAIVVAILFISSLISKSLMYNTEVNVVLNPLIKPIKTYFKPAEQSRNVRFEQPLRALGSPVPASGFNVVKPFKNVIIVILESVRYAEFSRVNQVDSNGFHMPFLKKIANEGLLQKCYVSVPHTSKAQFAILTGRNPYADIEMRESMIGKVPSIVSLLKETKGSRSHFITVQNLNFENTSGMLKAVGFESLIGPSDLNKYGKVIESSSFGLTDEALLSFPYQDIKQDKPFLLTFMTIAAHHPYDYPNKEDQEDTTHAAYLKAGEAADKSIALLFDRMAQYGLLNDTLVVMVGDHGESFGEHGTFIHNSSMHEEEVTVPLILWSNDGRLRDVQLRKQARQIDIAPTIAELLGVAENENYTLQGLSLIKRAGVDDEPVFISTFFSGLSQAIVHDEIKTILHSGEGKITQFDLRVDPDELNGKLVSGQEYSEYLNRFRQYNDYHGMMFRATQ